jgi:hypothetical protein
MTARPTDPLSTAIRMKEHERCYRLNSVYDDTLDRIKSAPACHSITTGHRIAWDDIHILKSLPSRSHLDLTEISLSMQPSKPGIPLWTGLIVHRSAARFRTPWPSSLRLQKPSNLSLLVFPSPPTNLLRRQALQIFSFMILVIFISTVHPHDPPPLTNEIKYSNTHALL